MLEAAIIVFGPIMVTGIMGLMVAPLGLVWSPFAALIASRMASNRGLDGGRYARAGAISSIFLLLPWLLLVIGLRKGRLHPTVLRCMYIFVHLVWLIGPVVWWGQYVLSLQSPTPEVVLPGTEGEGLVPPPPNLIEVYGLFGLMVVLWIVSASITADVWLSKFTGEFGEIMSFRYMVPFVGAWVCTLALWGYLIFLVD